MHTHILSLCMSRPAQSGWTILNPEQYFTFDFLTFSFFDVISGVLSVFAFSIFCEGAERVVVVFETLRALTIYTKIAKMQTAERVFRALCWRRSRYPY